MARIKFTHFFDGFHTLFVGYLIIGFGGLIAGGTILEVLEPVWDRISGGFSEGLQTIIEWGAGFGIIAGTYYLLFKFVWIPLEPLPTWLYLRLTLYVPATWRDAKTTGFLFDGDITGTWYPLLELKKLPRELRREALYEFAKQTPVGALTLQQSPSLESLAEVIPLKPDADQRLNHAREVLGVTPEATEEEIENALRELIRKYQSLAFSNSQPENQRFVREKTDELTAAYDLLVKTKNGRIMQEKRSR